MAVPIPPAIPFVKASGLSALGITKLPGIGGIAKAASALGSFGGLFGGDDGPGFQEQLNNQRVALRDLTRQSYAEKMRAAKKYGIHPLTMMGTGSIQPSAPVYSGGGSNMGQNIGEAISRGASQYLTGKESSELNALTLERAKLENDLLRSQITSINNPARAGSAYSNDQRVLNLPDENIRRKQDERGLTAGSENPPPARS